MGTRKIAAKAYKAASEKKKGPDPGAFQKDSLDREGFIRESAIKSRGRGKAGGVVGRDAQPSSTEGATRRDAQPSSTADRTGTGGYRKAAKFILLLGKKEAAKVLKHFSDTEIEIITREIASIKKVTKEESIKILQEFGYLEPAKAYTSTGGVEAAKAMLVTAFGEEKGSAIFNKVLPFGGEKPFAFLEDLEDEQLILVLRKETPSVLAVVFSYLEPSKASVVLETLHPDIQKELIRRLGGIKKVAPEAIRAIEATLIERIRSQGKIVTEEIDGSSILASILKNMDLSDEDRILSELSRENEKISEVVKEKLFTVESILDLRDKDLQKILRDYSDREIAVLIKGRSDELREKILSNVSGRRREFILMESESLGKMLRSEVDKTMKEFLDYLREQEARGSILFNRQKDVYI